MANHWLRLWHDMPNDPKWRTIARLSNQPISVVQATYVHLLVEASRNVTRGHASVTAEDLASALDVTEGDVQAILDAMQKRVLDGMYLMGWEKRQPKREDSADGTTTAKTPAQRKAEQRERERQSAENAKNEGNVTQCHDESHNVTTDKEERRKEYKPKAPATPLPEWLPIPAWEAFIAMRKQIKKPLTVDAFPLALKKLEKLKSEGHDPRAVLEQSVLNSWQGLFEVKPGSEISKPAVKKDWE